MTSDASAYFEPGTSPGVVLKLKVPSPILCSFSVFSANVGNLGNNKVRWLIIRRVCLTLTTLGGGG